MQPVLALLASHKHKENNMGQFKPMVKMETTEPTVELKLKKGGHVNMKKGGKAEAGHKKMAMGGGAMDMMSGTPALVGRPAVNAPVRAPMKPSMASRRKSMMAKKPAMTPSSPAMGMSPMKKGGKAEGGESKATHKAEMSKMKGLEKELKSHESKPASKGHKGLKTGGYKDGGMSMVEKDGKMVPDFAADGKGKMKKGGKAMMGGGGMHMMPNGNMMKNSSMKMGGMATGGAKMGNAGGFKSGGKSSKKAYATGGTVNSGRAVAMPQGAKKPSSPVSTNRNAGTFKKGGKVTPAEGNLMKTFGKENAPAMKSAKAQSNEVYSKYQKMAGGGSVSDKEMDKSTADYDKAAKYGRELEDAMNPLSMAKEMYDKVRNSKIVKEASDFADEYGDLYMKGLGLRSMNEPGPRVTKSKQSVTVSKKRGGSAC